MRKFFGLMTMVLVFALATIAYVNSASAIQIGGATKKVEFTVSSDCITNINYFSKIFAGNDDKNKKFILNEYSQGFLSLEKPTGEQIDSRLPNSAWSGWVINDFSDLSLIPCTITETVMLPFSEIKYEDGHFETEEQRFGFILKLHVSKIKFLPDTYDEIFPSEAAEKAERERVIRESKRKKFIYDEEL